MKEDLSRKEIKRWIVNGFEVYKKYRVELGRKIWKKNAEKLTFWAKFEYMYWYM